MKKGDIVMVYERPLTQEGIEGEARLINRLLMNNSNHQGQEYWRVQFLSDGFVVGRWIKPNPRRRVSGK